MKLAVLFLPLALLFAPLQAEKKPVNILLITADDLGHEALPFLGGSPKDITPNLSKLATQGLSFHHAHINMAICAPSRSIIATGRYGHNSGCFGFNKLSKDLPTVFGTLQKNGYLTGILGKVPPPPLIPNSSGTSPMTTPNSTPAAVRKSTTTTLSSSSRAVRRRTNPSTSW